MGDAPAVASCCAVNMLEDVFYQRRASNAFDNLVVDVEDLYRRFPLELRQAWPGGGPPPLTRAQRLTASPWLPLRGRTAASRLLTHLRLDQRWFQRFRGYWTDVLAGRPLLSVEDFHFLRGVYRIRHQDNQVPDTEDAGTHEIAWQRPELLYQVFQQAYGEALGPKHVVCAALRRFHRGPIGAMLEFGSASAPVTTTYLDYFGPAPRTRFFISDIRTLAFHYGAYKFRRTPNVTPISLEPGDGFALRAPQALDVICCLTVFEHLTRPLALAEEMHAALRPGGLLVFDYMQGQGEGLDTFQGVRDRQAVLDFIRARFDVAVGSVTPDRHVDLTVAVKR